MLRYDKNQTIDGHYYKIIEEVAKTNLAAINTFLQKLDAVNEKIAEDQPLSDNDYKTILRTKEILKKMEESKEFLAKRIAELVASFENMSKTKPEQTTDLKSSLNAYKESHETTLSRHVTKAKENYDNIKKNLREKRPALFKKNMENLSESITDFKKTFEVLVKRLLTLTSSLEDRKKKIKSDVSAVDQKIDNFKPDEFKSDDLGLIKKFQELESEVREVEKYKKEFKEPEVKPDTPRSTL